MGGFAIPAPKANWKTSALFHLKPLGDGEAEVVVLRYNASRLSEKRHSTPSRAVVDQTYFGASAKAASSSPAR
jgi:hypothetical protein